jgi:hypothetical protein
LAVLNIHSVQIIPLQAPSEDLYCQLAPGLLLHRLDHGQVTPHSKARELRGKARGELVKFTNIHIKQDISVVN